MHSSVGELFQKSRPPRGSRTAECIVGGSILRCYCKQKLVRRMRSALGRFGMVTMSWTVLNSGFSRARIFHKRDFLSLVLFVSRFFDRALLAATSSNRPCRSCARCIARSDWLDPIEPLRTTVESYPEMVGIDVTAALPSSLFLALPFSPAGFISFHAKR